MDYLVVGMNHKTAPVSLREKLALPASALEGALQKLIATDSVNEGFILSTCNRVEVYAVSPECGQGIQKVKNFFYEFHHMAPDTLVPHLYEYQALDAIKHLFRVTSSLDSMIVGEPQIVGQVKEAYKQALATKSSGVFLNRFVDRALYVSKKIRTETQISAKSVSVGSQAVELAKKIFGDLTQKKVVLIGAGKVGELVISYLEEQGVYDICLVNRTLEKATDLVRQTLGVSYPLEKLGEVLLKADVVIASLAVPEALITHKQIVDLMEKRKNKPLFLIDLGVPRNIEPAINTLANVYLYNIDDLTKVIDKNKEARLSESQMAEEIIEKEASQFYQSVVQEEPTIALLGKKFDAIRRRELTKTLSRLAHLGDHEKKVFEKCTEAIVNKILYDPMITLKSGKPHKQNAHNLLKRLFRLEDEEG